MDKDTKELVERLRAPSYTADDYQDMNSAAFVIEQFASRPAADESAKPVAPSSLPPPFRDWFNRAWNSFEDKGHVNMVYCMAWALKAYRAFSVPASTASKEAKPAPFLWFVSDDPDADGWCVHKESEAKDHEQDGCDVIALYDHRAPVSSKEAVTLSDEEIVKYWLETPRGMALSKYHGVLVFARAILAQRDASKAEGKSC